MSGAWCGSTVLPGYRSAQMQGPHPQRRGAPKGRSSLLCDPLPQPREHPLKDQTYPGPNFKRSRTGLRLVTRSTTCRGSLAGGSERLYSRWHEARAYPPGPLFGLRGRGSDTEATPGRVVGKASLPAAAHALRPVGKPKGTLCRSTIQAKL
jgi:hypothetical protein